MTPDAASGPPRESGGGIWSGTYLPMTSAIMMVVAIVAFGGLALVAALSSIADDLGRVAWLPWVITGYMAAAAISVVVAGPVIDAVGARRTFRVTGVWFLVASVAAGVAPSMPALVVARVLQGFGGGLLFAVVLAAIGLAYPAHLRARALAAQSVIWGVIGLGSPALAALVLAVGGWRMILAVKIPLAAAALVTGWNRLPTTGQTPARIRVDWPGLLLLASVVVCSLVAVSQIGTRWWAAAVLLAGTVVFITTYWIYSGRAANPVLARQHITRFPLLWVHLTSGLAMLAAIGLDNYLPLYVQTTRGRSVEFAAFSLIYVTAGWSTGSVIYSRGMSHRSESDSILVGYCLIISAMALAGTAIALNWPLAALFGALALVGVSVGLISTAGLALLQASSERAEMGRVNAAHQFFRQLCVTYGVAVAGAILLFVVDVRVGDIDAVRDVISGEDVTLGEQTRDAIGAGLAWIGLVNATITVGGLVIAASLTRRVRTRDPGRGSALDRNHVESDIQ